MMKAALARLEGLGGPDDYGGLHDRDPASRCSKRSTGMIFKEENILFPTSLEKLDPSDWVDILKQSDEIGYVFIEKPKETKT